jgi:hypothetical protein
MDSFEITGRGAIKRFVELAHSGPYDMLLDVATAWDEMVQDADAGVKYNKADFIEAGEWAAQDVVVNLDLILEIAFLIEEANRE